MIADELVKRALSLAAPGERAILGIAGSPGSGKTTLAEELTARISERVPAAYVPMDGFHLADVELDRLGRRPRKGALDTFDGWGYLNMLRRLAARDEPEVYAPGFDRVIEQPIAGTIRVPREAAIVVTEGNYLLVTADPWGRIAPLLTECWFCRIPERTRLTRLIARHHEFGKDAAAAEAWATGPDQRNADLIEPTAVRAALIVSDGIVSDGIATNSHKIP